jgi:pSer/pThr/pTyr-binding forkhead associated (FHA) protein
MESSRPQDRAEPDDRWKTQTGQIFTRPDRRLEPDKVLSMHLEVVGGPMDGTGVRVTEDIVTLGRGDRCHLPLRLDPLVSTTHARIVREGHSYYLEDLGSRNGTYIGEQRIEARALIAPGSLFVVGSTCLEFTSG